MHATPRLPHVLLSLLLLLFVTPDPSGHGKTKESVEERLDTLSQDIGNLNARQKMWEELQNKNRADWLAVQKERQDANLEAIKGIHQSSLNEIKDFREDFENDFNSKIDMVDKWVSVTTSSMEIFIAVLGLFVAILGLGSFFGYRNYKALAEEKAEEVILQLKKAAEKNIEELNAIRDIASCKLEKLHGYEESARICTERIKKHEESVLGYKEYIQNADELEEGKPTDAKSEDSNEVQADDIATATYCRGSKKESNASEIEIKKIINEYKALLKKGELHEAEKLLMQLRYLKPENDDYNIAYAILCNRISSASGSFDDKIGWAKKAEEIFKKHAVDSDTQSAWANYGIALVNLAMAYGSSQHAAVKAQEAIEAFEKANGFSSDSLSYESQLAVAHSIIAYISTNITQIVEHSYKTIDYATKALSKNENDLNAIYAKATARSHIFSYDCNKTEEDRAICKHDTMLAIEACKNSSKNQTMTIALQYNLVALASTMEERIEYIQETLKSIASLPREQKTAFIYNVEVGCMLRMIELCNDQNEKGNLIIATYNVYSERKEIYKDSRFYNDACIEARMGKPHTAIRILEELFNLNKLPSYKEMLEDPDLKELRDMPEFIAIIEGRKAEE